MVSIIILSYNTKELLKKCLRSVITHLDKKTFELIVVDNASSDGSSEMVRKDFPEVLLVENKENTGFTKGNNIGAKKVKGDLLLFLNSDTELQDDSLNSMISFMKEKSAGIVGGKMKNTDGSLQRSYGKFYTLPRIFFMLVAGEKGELLSSRITSPQQVDWVSGGFMLVVRKVFEDLGGFDENIFMYIEDMEFCYRAKQKNQAVYFYPQAVVAHHGYGSSNRTFAIVQIYTGLLYFYRKHKSAVEYTMLKKLLQLKALAVITVGSLTHKPMLVTTYKKALGTIV